ncbi:MAG: bifunctional DNA primase/polymerase [Anaerolineales bacterium]|nr:bifunctional DNA primase/polymerase [Anaerolineales bacterium]
MQDVRAVLKQYAELGFDTLPLEPGTKRARLKGWPRLTPEQMWQDAPENANVGIRGGGSAHLAIIDCDDKEKPGTYQNFLSWFDGLGYKESDLVIIKTASGVGRHIYITLDGSLPGHARNVSKSFGAGEFRHGFGAYVAAPPSVVDSSSYSLVSGNLYRRPTLTAQDVLQFLGPQKSIRQALEPIPFRRSGYIPKRTLALLNGLGIESYQSRSHADQAILTGLVNAGFGFDGALQLFSKYPGTGKFQEIQAKSTQQAFSYLRTSFDNAFKFASAQESRPRQLASQAKEWAMSKPWPGKSGQYDKSVFIAHASIAHHACRYEYGASVRDLAERAGLSPEACMNATRRLCEAGLISLVKEWIADCSNTYRLESQTLTLPHRLKRVVSRFGTGDR